MRKLRDGEPLGVARAHVPEIGNSGYPSEPGEIDHFMGMLRKTVQRTSPAQLAAIEKKLNEERQRREASERSRAVTSHAKPST